MKLISSEPVSSICSTSAGQYSSDVPVGSRAQQSARASVVCFVDLVHSWGSIFVTSRTRRVDVCQLYSTSYYRNFGGYTA